MRFSIITICRNAERYIGQTIRSVLDQEWPDLEYIVVDGCSTDATLDMIRRHAENDKRVRVISEPDKGIADAMNKGISLSSGSVIAHLHADDFYPDRHTCRRVADAFAASPGGVWATGGASFVNSSGRTLRDIPVRRYSYGKLLRGNTLFHPSTFVRRYAFDAVGMFDIRLKYAMDYDLWLRLGKLSPPVPIDAVLSCFRVHEGSLSTTESARVLTEEYGVRLRYLQGNYRSRAFHGFYYLIKRMTNRLVLKRLFGES